MTLHSEAVYVNKKCLVNINYSQETEAHFLDARGYTLQAKGRDNISNEPHTQKTVHTTLQSPKNYQMTILRDSIFPCQISL